MRRVTFFLILWLVVGMSQVIADEATTSDDETKAPERKMSQDKKSQPQNRSQVSVETMDGRLRLLEQKVLDLERVTKFQEESIRSLNRKVDDIKRWRRNN